MGLLHNCSGLQHIGIPSANQEDIVSFLIKIGFMPDEILQNKQKNIVFLRYKDLVLEVWPAKDKLQKSGTIDHIALNVLKVNTLYEDARAQGFNILEDKLQELAVGVSGVRFFTILGPEGLKIEFNQYL